jgi:hypothetical protein
MDHQQTTFFEYVDEEQEKRDALDDLFASADQYRNSQTYYELLQFIGRFTKYSPYNCFLLYMQNPNVTFVATPNQWRRKHGRLVKEDAQPLIILAPMHPVLFVYDLADTEGRDIPEYLTDPFSTDGEIPDRVWRKTCIKTNDDNIAILYKELSSLHAGSAIRYEKAQKYISHDGEEYFTEFVIELNNDLPLTSRYATLIHELGHIYCGHLGNIEGADWPDRASTPDSEKEIEAESISYLVCSRRGIQSRSHEYLATKAEESVELPPFSFHTVLRVARRIEEMGGKI